MEGKNRRKRSFLVGGDFPVLPCNRPTAIC